MTPKCRNEKSIYAFFYYYYYSAQVIEIIISLSEPNIIYAPKFL